MARLVVTSCGTSLLTNTASPEERKRLIALANARDLEGDDRAFLRHCHEQAATRLLSGGHDPRRLSAELNGLLTYFRSDLPRDATHLLIRTDTALGEAAADLLADWLERRAGARPQILTSAGLAPRSPDELRWGLAHLMRELTGWLEGYPERMFNLSGGFKSLNGFLQTVATVYGAEAFYIFEAGKDVVTIPRLPVRLDLDLFSRHAALFRRLATVGHVPAEELRRADIPETLWLEIDGGAVLSEWGELLWERARADLYREALQPPPPPIRYAPRLAEDVARRFREHLSVINDRIDQLAKHLQRSGRDHAGSPKGLDFKPLRGNPRPPSTHEFDVTHSHGALRGFGHFEGETFVVDDLDWHA